MEASDAADQLRELGGEGQARSQAAERFRTRSAISIAVLAMLLAISSLGGQNATKETINSNILASDTWAFFQAKNIRQTSFRLAADELELLLPTLPPEQQAATKQKVDTYKGTVARYESEPDPQQPDNPLKGDGKKELTIRAKYWEEKRDHAQKQDPNFDYSVALYQIAIVLGSVSIVANSRHVMALSLALGAVATMLMVNGFFLWLDLPFG